MYIYNRLNMNIDFRDIFLKQAIYKGSIDKYKIDTNYNLKEGLNSFNTDFHRSTYEVVKKNTTTHFKPTNNKPHNVKINNFIKNISNLNQAKINFIKSIVNQSSIGTALTLLKEFNNFKFLFSILSIQNDKKKFRIQDSNVIIIKTNLSFNNESEILFLFELKLTFDIDMNNVNIIYTPEKLDEKYKNYLSSLFSICINNNLKYYNLLEKTELIRIDSVNNIYEEIKQVYKKKNTYFFEKGVLGKSIRLTEFKKKYKITDLTTVYKKSNFIYKYKKVNNKKVSELNIPNEIKYFTGLGIIDIFLTQILDKYIDSSSLKIVYNSVKTVNQLENENKFVKKNIFNISYDKKSIGYFTLSIYITWDDIKNAEIYFEIEEFILNYDHKENLDF